MQVCGAQPSRADLDSFHVVDLHLLGPWSPLLLGRERRNIKKMTQEVLMGHLSSLFIGLKSTIWPHLDVCSTRNVSLEQGPLLRTTLQYGRGAPGLSGKLVISITADQITLIAYDSSVFLVCISSYYLHTSDSVPLASSFISSRLPM